MKGVKNTNNKAKSKVSTKQLVKTKHSIQGKRSRTKWSRLKNLTDKDIDTSDLPELTESFWANAIMGSPLRKRLISLRLDKDVIDWFKDAGPNYQTRINQVLRTYMEWKKGSGILKVAETKNSCLSTTRRTT